MDLELIKEKATQQLKIIADIESYESELQRIDRIFSTGNGELTYQFGGSCHYMFTMTRDLINIDDICKTYRKNVVNKIDELKQSLNE